MRQATNRKKVVRRGTAEKTLPRGVSPEVLEDIFLNAFYNLSDYCIEPWPIERANPNVVERTEEAKDRLGKVWRDALAGKATLEEFRWAVRQWKEVCLAFVVREVAGCMRRVFPKVVKRYFEGEMGTPPTR